MTELLNRLPPLSDGYTQMLKTIFTWMNNHPRGEICSSDFKRFREDYNLNPGLLDSILITLAEKKYLRQIAKASRIRQGSEVLVIVGEEEDVWTFGEFAFDFAYEHKLIVEHHKIPAADRFVSASDNQTEVDQAVSSLEKLAQAVKYANDLFVNAEERIQISKEIDAFKEILKQPNIHLVALRDFIKNNSTVSFLCKQTVSAVVQKAANLAIENLDKLFYLLISKL